MPTVAAFVCVRAQLSIFGIDINLCTNLFYVCMCNSLLGLSQQSNKTMRGLQTLVSDETVIDPVPFLYLIVQRP
jgi:hypothetical protein